MFERTREIVLAEGEEKSKRFYMNFEGGLYKNKEDGLTDNTHLRYDGAFMVATCFYEEMKKLNLYPEIFIDLAE